MSLFYFRPPLLTQAKYAGIEKDDVMLEKMRNRLKMLPDRQRRLLAYRYGLKSMECKTISETAAFFNMMEKFIEEIERGALKTLRDGMDDSKII